MGRPGERGQRPDCRPGLRVLNTLAAHGVPQLPAEVTAQDSRRGAAQFLEDSAENGRPGCGLCLAPAALRFRVPNPSPSVATGTWAGGLALSRAVHWSWPRRGGMCTKGWRQVTPGWPSRAPLRRPAAFPSPSARHPPPPCSPPRAGPGSDSSRAPRPMASRRSLSCRPPAAPVAAALWPLQGWADCSGFGAGTRGPGSAGGIGCLGAEAEPSGARAGLLPGSSS